MHVWEKSSIFRERKIETAVCNQEQFGKYGNQCKFTVWSNVLRIMWHVAMNDDAPK